MNFVFFCDINFKNSSNYINAKQLWRFDSAAGCLSDLYTVNHVRPLLSRNSVILVPYTKQPFDLPIDGRTANSTSVRSLKWVSAIFIVCLWKSCTFFAKSQFFKQTLNYDNSVNVINNYCIY